MASTTVAFSSSSSSSLSKSNVVKKRSPLRGKTCIAMAGKPFEVPKKYTKVQPMGGRVLIKIAETERETKGGVLLTEGESTETNEWYVVFVVVRWKGARWDAILLSRRRLDDCFIQNTIADIFFLSLFCFFF